MTKTLINFRDPKTNKRRIGCLDDETKRVNLSDGRNYSLNYLKSKDTNGIGYFDTWTKGKKVQKVGKYKK